MSAEPTRVLRFHENGEALDVLLDERAEVADPPAGSIRVRVIATGLNPADWALTSGFLPGPLPRGVGYDVAGTVESIGEGVEGLAVGDAVVGSADLALPSAGAGELAILNNWAAVPEGLEPVQAATIPMVSMTADWTLDAVDLEPGKSILINGAGGMVGYTMVQNALYRGLKVFATAGPTFTPDLTALGAQVTGYGEGVVERVRALTGGADVDFVLDASRHDTGDRSLSDFLELVGGDPKRVMTISNHAGAAELGIRINLNELGSIELAPASEIFARYAELAACGEFRLPIARVFPFDEWRDAVALSESGRSHGKVVLLAPEASA